MVKRFSLLPVLLILLILSGCTGNRQDTGPVIYVSPVYLYRGSANVNSYVTFSIQCRFSRRDDVLTIAGMEGDHLDGLSNVWFHETTPEYASGIRREGGYYRSYGMQFQSEAGMTVSTLHLLLNGEPIDLTLEDPVVLELSDACRSSDLYFSFRPAVISTASVGYEYTYTVHANRNLTVSDVGFPGHLDISSCVFSDTSTGSIVPFSSESPVRLLAGHSYNIGIQCAFSESLGSDFCLFRDLQSTLCIRYIPEDEPETSWVSYADLTCTGVSNEDDWKSFMKEVKP